MSNTRPTQDPRDNKVVFAALAGIGFAFMGFFAYAVSHSPLANLSEAEMAIASILIQISSFMTPMLMVAIVLLCSSNSKRKKAQHPAE